MIIVTANTCYFWWKLWTTLLEYIKRKTTSIYSWSQPYLKLSNCYLEENKHLMIFFLYQKSRKHNIWIFHSDELPFMSCVNSPWTNSIQFNSFNSVTPINHSSAKKRNRHKPASTWIRENGPKCVNNYRINIVSLPNHQVGLPGETWRKLVREWQGETWEEIYNIQTTHGFSILGLLLHHERDIWQIYVYIFLSISESEYNTVFLVCLKVPQSRQMF